MAHYDDLILPFGMSRGSNIGSKTNTQQILMTSGIRKTNRRWNQKLRKFDIGYNVKSAQDIYTILDIFEAVDGPHGSFLARPWNDWNTTDGMMEPGDEQFITETDQPLLNTITNGIQGDGSTVTFQAIKDYSGGSATANHRRTILKLQNGTVKVAVNGVLQTESVDYNVNYSTGVITFTVAPGNGLNVTWGGAFYVAVAFLDDEFMEQLDYHNNETSIMLQEVRFS